jgi:hypothetical protein
MNEGKTTNRRGKKGILGTIRPSFGPPRRMSVNSSPTVSEASAALQRELVPHLRLNHTQLREEFARRITEAQLVTAMTKEEIFTEATSVYDNFVRCWRRPAGRPSIKVPRFFAESPIVWRWCRLCSSSFAAASFCKISA